MLGSYMHQDLTRTQKDWEQFIEENSGPAEDGWAGEDCWRFGSRGLMDPDARSIDPLWERGFPRTANSATEEESRDSVALYCPRNRVRGDSRQMNYRGSEPRRFGSSEERAARAQRQESPRK